MNPELKKYVDDARLVGKSDAQIAQDLRGGGWSEPEISSAISGVPGPVTSSSGTGMKLSSILIAIVAVLFVPSLIMQGIYRASYNTNESEPIVLPPLPPEEKDEAFVRSQTEDKQEAFVRSQIYGFRSNAENYYKSNKNSYKDMCVTTKNPLAKVYSDLRAIPNVEIKCESTQNEYAFSARSGTGRFWCTNSMGFVTETDTSDVNAVCK